METTEEKQNIMLFSRQRAEIGGVREVGAFSETGITLETTLGMLAIEGKGLKIESFSSERGEIYINGTVDGMYYFGKKAADEKRGIFSKLLG